MSMSGLGKYKIEVDVADLANGDSIASYLVSASGDLITSASINGNQSLRVVAASEFEEDSVHVSGDRGVQVLAVRHDDDATGVVSADGDYAPLLVDANGRLKVSASIEVDSDFVYAEDIAHTSGDLGASILVVRKDALSSNVSADGDYATPLQWSEGSLKVVDIPNIAITVAAVNVTTTETSLGAPIANRRNTMIQNRGNAAIFVGPTGVTAATGIELPKGASMDIDFGPAVTIYAICAVGTADVRVMQLS